MFKLTKNNEFWWNVDFNWVDEEGNSETETVRFRFLRTTIQDYRKMLDVCNKEREALTDDKKLEYVTDRELMRKLITDVDDEVEVEGITDKREIIDYLLGFNVILSATVLAYQNAVMDGGQARDAVKK